MMVISAISMGGIFLLIMIVQYDVSESKWDLFIPEIWMKRQSWNCNEIPAALTSNMFNEQFKKLPKKTKHLRSLRHFLHIILGHGTACHQMTPLLSLSPFHFHFLQAWQDYQLTWNSSEFGGVDSVVINPRHLWIPDLLLYNRCFKKAIWLILDIHPIFI